MSDNIEDQKERAIVWAREQYLKRYGDDPSETQCKRPYCDMSGHPALGGYCSCECESRHDDEMEIEELEAEVKLLRQVLKVSPIILRSVYCNGSVIHLYKDIRLPISISYESEFYLEVIDDELGLHAYADTREALVAELEEQVHLIYDLYVRADPNTLTEKAKQVRLNWIELSGSR